MADSGRRLDALILAALAVVALRASALGGEAKWFHYPEQLELLKLEPAGSKGWSVAAKAVSPTCGIAYPGDMVSVELTVSNTGDTPFEGEAVIEVVRVGCRYERLASERDDPMAGGQVIATVPLDEPARFAMPTLKLEPKKEAILRWQQAKGTDFARLGTYVVIVELPDKRRQVAATFARVQPPNPAAGDGKGSPLIYRLYPGFDLGRQLDAAARLGYRWVHAGGMPNWASVSQKDPSAPFDWSKADAWADAFRKRGLLMLSNLCGSPRQTITDANWAAGNHVHDAACDARFGDFVEEAVSRYCGADGKGPLRIIDFWDQPWEGGGAAGWKSDSARYRTLYKIVHERAHKASGHILVGGTSAITNTLDKFFSLKNGEEQWGRYFDVLTDHGVLPHACFGPRIAQKLAIPSIETELWLGNSPATLVAAATHVVAAGQRKVSPCHATQLLWQNGPAGPMPCPPAAAASFFLHFLAGLDFERVLLLEHLPWVYQWGGGERMAFILAGDRSRLDPRAATMYDQVRANGTVSVDALDGKLKAYDLCGNPYPIAGGRYRLPCSTTSIYLEAPEMPMSVTVDAVSSGRIEEVRPVEFLVDDFFQPISEVKSVDFEVHNVLNRLIYGTVIVTAPAAFSLQESRVAVSLPAGTRKTIRLPVNWAKVHPANSYPFKFHFESTVGNADWSETLHVNTIAYGHPTIDGNLQDWKDAIPVIVHTADVEFNLAEVGWRPWESRTDIEKGLAEIRFMWNEENFYIAVRERNKGWQPKPRLSTRSDGDYFGTGDMAHTYVKAIWDALPFSGHCLQLGLRYASFRVRLPPCGTVPPRMLADDDTDCEYAIWGTPEGGAEVWRSNAADLGFFNFLPRCMPERYNGVPKGTKGVVRRLGSDTIYEIAIPFADMEGLNPAAGKIIRMALALPGSGLLLGEGRSRTRSNALTLKPTWMAQPSNDVRWGFIRP